MKPELTSQKLRGGYYTPHPIADFLAEWAVQSPITTVLEPSCGDGNILEAAVRRLLTLGAEPETVARLIHGVEADAEEAEKTQNRLRELGIPPVEGQLHTGDFFAYCKHALLEQHFLGVVTNPGRSFDAIVGNPPFIRYQHFPEQHRKVAFELMQQVGLHPTKLTNTWVPFLVLSTLLLTEHGRLAMVIPAELFQVNYAAEIRLFLSDYYRKITLVTFKKLLFEGVQQEIVLLLGERDGTDDEGIRTLEFDDIEDLVRYEYNDFGSEDLKPMDHSTEKWTQYFLDTEEILLLRALREHPLLTISRDVIDVDVGVVTGANDFFVLKEQQVQKYLLEQYVQPIVTRSAHLEGAVFTLGDYEANTQSQYPTFLLDVPNVPKEELPEPVRHYVSLGEDLGIQKGYKCKIRKRWYIVPSVWTPDAFMLRQVHGYPKIIINEADATSTDTIHRVRFINGTGGRVVAAAFLNSLTLAFSEVTGRSYGGGVLTFEPSESENLPLPLVGADRLDLGQIDTLLRMNQIEQILDITDQVLLREGLGLSVAETQMLRGIWEKLRDRRINRK